MYRHRVSSIVRFVLLSSIVLAANSYASGEVDELPRFHEDYYEGFAQGVYYGLLLRGEDYDIAWCMKAELAYEAKAMGGGGDFQKGMELLLKKCRARPGGPDSGR